MGLCGSKTKVDVNLAWDDAAQTPPSSQASSAGSSPEKTQ